MFVGHAPDAAIEDLMSQWWDDTVWTLKSACSQSLRWSRCGMPVSVYVGEHVDHLAVAELGLFDRCVVLFWVFAHGFQVVAASRSVLATQDTRDELEVEHDRFA